MGVKTKIDWCDSTWNPVTGCLHGCEYCYARKIAERFSAESMERTFEGRCVNWFSNGSKELDYAVYAKGHKQPYPFGFAPTLHRYKLDEPQHWKKPRTIFVCSMADLFGEWVPDEWIQDVFAACAEAPQHRYLFLTKNPKRYSKLNKSGKIPETIDCWFGATTERMDDEYPVGFKSFVSIEPIMEPFNGIGTITCGWVIVGAETGNRKDKVVPEKGWIMPILDRCREQGVPIFMKESLREIMGEDFRQEFPWEVKT